MKLTSLAGALVLDHLFHVNGQINQQQLLQLNNWTWINGGNGTNQPGSYGVLGEASPSNQPGSRCRHSMVMNSGLIYVFGGYAFTNSNSY